MNLTGAKYIAFDTETYDPNLREAGSGVYRRDGKVLGVSLATDTGQAEYYNIGHPGVSAEEKNKNTAVIAEVLASPIPKVGANILYDEDWLGNGYKFKINGKRYDIQVAEPLLDEYQGTYSLDFQGQKYLKRGKQKTKLDAFCERAGLGGDPRQWIYLMPYADIREYAIEDVRMPIEIIQKQLPMLEEQGLMNVFEMEMDLFPLLLQMRNNGIRIDRTARDKNAAILEERVEQMTKELYEEYGTFNFNSTQQIAMVFDSLGVPYNIKEETGNPSIKKEDLERIDHPVAEALRKVREAEKILKTFLQGAFVRFDVNGRIHCEFVPMKQDEGGTVTGRFSSRNPNLQQVPSHDEEYGKMCRDVFLPEEDCDYGCIDYSQIEYRFIAHYAKGDKAEDIRKQYTDNPNTDYHKVVMDWTGVDRMTAKRLNFGMAYYMGAKAMSRKFNWTLDYAKELSARYHSLVPFMRPTRDGVVNVGKGRGYIRTILGRRSRVTADIRARRKEYIVFNHLIQGSAADLNKRSMVDAYKAGIYNVLTPHITVHDEQGVSVPRTKEGVEAYRELKHIMETCMELRVPIVASAEIGPSWGSTKPCDFDAMLKEYA
jgi:DNA polymerase I-like protein with 3'-5' exonuclease and polymerase domains